MLQQDQERSIRKRKTATSSTATLPRNNYNKVHVAYATGLNLPLLSQTSRSKSSRRNYMTHSLRVKITIFFSSIHLNLSLAYTTISSSIQLLLTRAIGPSYYFINPRLLKQVIFCDKKSIRPWAN